MGNRAQLQGTSWHEEQMHKSCKDGSKYCVYNRNGICAFVVGSYYKQNCVGKGICDNFESKTGTPKIVSEKTIIIKQNPHNSKLNYSDDKHSTLQTVKIKQYEKEQPLMNDENINQVDEELNNDETPEERFARVSLNRIRAVTEDLRRISNLSNKSRYSYTDDQINKMFDHIDRAVRKAKEAFAEKEFIEEFTWDE